MDRRFDVNKMDFDGVRLKRRKKMLLYSLPLIIIVLLIAAKLLSVSLVSAASYQSYQANDYAAAERGYSFLTIVNIIEPYKVLFNLGAAQYQQKHYSQAQASFESALRSSVPRDFICTIRVNLSLSLEAQADALVSDKKNDQAVVLYEQALASLRDGRCADDKQQGQAAKDGEDRIKQKSDDAKQQRNGDSSQGDDQSSDSDSQSQEMTEAQQDELAEQAKRAQGERSKGADRPDNQAGDDEPSTDRPW